MRIDAAERDTRVRVVDVTGGRKLVHRLSSLGVVPGAELTIVRPRSPSLISIGGAKVAIGEEAAHAIEVTAVES